MSTVSPLQPSSSRDFPAEWYDSAPETHFWMEWRRNVILRHLERLHLDIRAPLNGFDIGCGHGAFQRQLTSVTSWTIDGCDLNENAISLNRGHHGRAYLYNIFDSDPNLKNKYDLVFLLDVIEHIEKPIDFLNAAQFYLKPSGYLVVNVPAIPSLYSKYDTVAGHVRRYTRSSLQAEIAAAGLDVEKSVYWGMSLVPLLLLRKAVVASTKPEDVIKRGFTPPGLLTDKFLRLAMSTELAIAKDVPYGTSLLALARKRPS